MQEQDGADIIEIIKDIILSTTNIITLIENILNGNERSIPQNVVDVINSIEGIIGEISKDDHDTIGSFSALTENIDGVISSTFIPIIDGEPAIFDKENEALFYLTGAGSQYELKLENILSQPNQNEGGNDTLYGGTGNDTLYGNAGNDRLYGEWDNDVLNGNAGNDTLTGGSGSDLFGFNSISDGSDVITDFNPTEDRIFFHENFAQDLTGFLHLENTTFQGITGAGIYWDDITTDSNLGQLIAILSGQNANRLSLSAPYFQGVPIPRFNGTEGEDQLIGTNVKDEINALQGNDFIDGQGGDDVLNGGQGDDIINGGAGNDTLDGSWGFDTLDGGDGIDTATYDFYDGGINASLTTGNVSFPNNSDNIERLISIENIIGSRGNDFLYGTHNNNTLDGNEGNDYLNGFDGDDILNGGDGNDVLGGLHGNDTLTGSSGSDRFGYGVNEGTDLITDFNPTELDRIEFSLDFANQENGFHYLANTTYQEISGVGVYWNTDNNTSQLITLLQNWDETELSLTDRYFQGAVIPVNYQEAHPRVLHNLINGTRADDQITAPSSNDEINTFGGNDHVIGGLGHDLINGGNGNDLIYGNYDNDTLNGERGNDYLHGYDGNDILNGGDGNDVLGGLHGNDTLTGGSGSDRFGYGVNEGTDIITDFNPTELDRIEFSLDFANLENGFHYLANTTYQGISGVGVYWNTDNNTSQLITLLQNWDETELSLTDRYFQGAVLPVDYQETHPRVLHNLINGTNAKDKIKAPSSNDEINTFGGNDHIIGGLGHDLINGGEGNDYIYGHYDNDTLNGEGGNDYLHGYDGDDILNGGEGNDKLIGLKGNDTLTGGIGKDMFGFTSVSDGSDVITDFSPSEDRISFYQSFAQDLTGFLHLENTTYQGISGAGVYWDDVATDTNPGQLIAVLSGQNANQLSLTAPYFRGIPG